MKIFFKDLFRRIYYCIVGVLVLIVGGTALALASVFCVAFSPIIGIALAIIAARKPRENIIIIRQAPWDMEDELH